MKTRSKQIIITILILLTGLLLFFLSSLKLPAIDARTDHYFKETVTDATLAYATTRGVNAVVSVLKESELDISPAGIGFTIAVGQILDPIDDMTERLSSVLVVSIVSLGLQKIINDIGSAVSFPVIGLLLPFFILPVWFNNRTVRLCGSLIGRLITLAVLLRFLLPISSLVNESLYQHIFADQIAETGVKLNIVSSRYRDLNSINQPQTGNLLSKLAQSTNLKIEKTKEIYTIIINNSEIIITSLVHLTILYVTLFLTQVILIPVFMFWLLLKIVDILFMTGMLRRFTSAMDRPAPAASPAPPEEIRFEALEP